MLVWCAYMAQWLRPWQLSHYFILQSSLGPVHYESVVFLSRISLQICIRQLFLWEHIIFLIISPSDIPSRFLWSVLLRVTCGLCWLKNERSSLGRYRFVKVSFLYYALMSLTFQWSSNTWGRIWLIPTTTKLTVSNPFPHYPPQPRVLLDSVSCWLLQIKLLANCRMSTWLGIQVETLQQDSYNDAISWLLCICEQRCWRMRGKTVQSRHSWLHLQWYVCIERA